MENESIREEITNFKEGEFVRNTVAIVAIVASLIAIYKDFQFEDRFDDVEERLVETERGRREDIRVMTQYCSDRFVEAAKTAAEEVKDVWNNVWY